MIGWEITWDEHPIEQDETVRFEAVRTDTSVRSRARAAKAEAEAEAEATSTPAPTFDWAVTRLGGRGRRGLGSFVFDEGGTIAYWTAESEEVRPGPHRITLDVNGEEADSDDLIVNPRGLSVDDQPVRVALRRADAVETDDQPLWQVIRQTTEALSFNRYKAFVDHVLCRGELRDDWEDAGESHNELSAAERRRRHECSIELPYPDIKAYKLLKCATEAFMLWNCSSVPLVDFRFRISREDAEERGLPDPARLRAIFRRYLVEIPTGERRVVDLVGALESHKTLRRHATAFRELMTSNGFEVDTSRIATLPYLAAIRENFPEVPLTVSNDVRDDAELCYAVLREKFTNPCLLELIWSYWHEEGMLVQTMNAISLRFQNRRGPGEVDPLAGLAINPLRPLGNLLWGYIQDEQHRLTLARRVYEYDHQYGLTLVGQAVPRVRGADSRSRFLEAFHNLLHRTSIFYREDDDTTMIADPFPVLNALRDVHLLLSEGAHNQYGDLPWTARQEMLMQQWLLSRGEFREFLPTRPSIAYPERWMARVDAMKTMQGWTDVSVRYFRDLALFGEQIVLAVRFGDWSNVTDREQAGNWARAWRQEVQWYIHAYQAVTGVDLSADMADVRQAEQARARSLQPAFHLQRRLIDQRRGAGVPMRHPIGPMSGPPV